MRNGFKNDTCAVAILNIGGVPGMAFGASDHPGASFGVLIRDGEPTCMRAWLAAIYPKNGIMLCISDIYSHRTRCDRVLAIEVSSRHRPTALPQNDAWHRSRRQ
ncbi:hypothetical protein CUJ84_Chr000940 [Rhizobium leguminosarum]|uniref:Uncharacterized protein n=1 Tax=Rhizobium leguminosarum TaxID=384 RepID=A0A2K9YZF4_RHILE|nr:hypothetical protein CUJ84_Chr000940 [Rhizobium leguminosarum]